MLKPSETNAILNTEMFKTAKTQWTMKEPIELAKNPMNHERSKHIDVRFHFIWDHVKEGSVEFLHVTSQDQVADIFTKPLPKVLFWKYRKMIGITDGRSI